MKFKMVHENYNVYDLQKSMDFYEKALGLKEKRRKEAPDGSFIIVYMGSDENDFLLELTWLKDMETASFILPFRPMILKQPTKSIRRWDVSALKIRKWEFTSLRIQMATGLKLCLEELEKFYINS